MTETDFMTKSIKEVEARAKPIEFTNPDNFINNFRYIKHYDKRNKTNTPKIREN